MSVYLRGKSYHYRFLFQGKDYFGPCSGCVTNAEAKEFERFLREKIRRQVATLAKEQEKVKHNKTIRALVDNYSYVLTGGKPITLAKAYPLALKKPSRREPSEHIAKQKLRYWNDFISYMAATYPEVLELAQVRKVHCEAYVRYLIDNGRFNKDVQFQVKAGKVAYTGKYKLKTKVSGKTIHEIARVCKEVFRKLQEDAGIVYNPWESVITPRWEQTDREIFSEQELIQIKNGINRDDELSVFCRPLFLVAAVTGLTEGDICTLKWAEISWATRMIFRERRKTKVDLAIPILSTLENYLKNLPQGGEYVFPQHADMYLRDASLISYRIKRFLEGLGIKTTKEFEDRKAVSIKDLHSMRHVFCYYAGQAGISLAVVQSIVGHMTQEMTKHYMSHATTQAKQEAIEKLPAFLVMNETVEIPELSERQRLVELAYSLPIEHVQMILKSNFSEVVSTGGFSAISHESAC